MTKVAGRRQENHQKRQEKLGVKGSWGGGVLVCSGDNDIEKNGL